MSWKKTFYEGLKSGIPIGLGYLPVSFTFGFLAVSGGLPVWVAVFISLTNLTSAGQFAGTNLILAGAGYFEVALTTFVINLRYMLMSLSLSQKLDEKTGTGARLALAFGITDEIFAVAAGRPGELSRHFLYGLIFLPFLGWSAGTLLGGIAGNILPPRLCSALGLAIYGMFFAIIIPPARKSRILAGLIAISFAASYLAEHLPGISSISSGTRTIILTVVLSSAAAILFPHPAEDSAADTSKETAEETHVHSADAAKQGA